MTNRPETRRRYLGATMLADIVLIVVYNFVANEFLPRAWYVPANAAFAVVLVSISMWGGATPLDIGLSKRFAKKGIVVGLVVGGLAIGIMAIGAALPMTKGFFDDARALEDNTLTMVVFNILIRFPLGTALLEEVAFRGVLYGLGIELWGKWKSAAVSSLLFGLWHIIPSIALLKGNQELENIFGTFRFVIGIPLAVLGAALVGYLFIWLREFSQSLYAPWLVHSLVNSGAFAISIIVFH